MKTLRVARDGSLFISAACYIAGVLCFLPVSLSPGLLCVLVGIMLIVYGAIRLCGYFSKDLYCLAFQYDLACGLMLIALGCIVLLCPHRVLPHLPGGLGLLVLADSLLTVQTSKDARSFGLNTWYVILITALLAGALGTALIVAAFHGHIALRYLSGATLLAEGLKNHCLVLYTVRMINRTARASDLDASEPE